MYLRGKHSSITVGLGGESANKVEATSDSPLRIFLLLENRLLREAMARILRKCDDFLVVGSDKKHSCSPQRLSESRCDVVVLDFLDLNWLRLARSANIADQFLPRFLLLGMSGEFEEFLAAVQAGVTSYLLKDASTAEILAAVRSTARGAAICPPVLCGCLFELVSKITNCRSAQTVVARPVLTVRQQRLTALVAKGLTNKEIASRLSLSQYTVRNHIHRIMKQVDAKSRSQAVETILSHGYTLIQDSGQESSTDGHLRHTL